MMMMRRFTVSLFYVLLFSSVLTVDAAEAAVAAVDAVGNVETIQAATPPIDSRPSSPFVELFGEKLIYLAPTSDGKSVQPQTIPTTDALAGKNVVGVYFSADWCEW
jgi:hypothetical protein